MGFKIVHANKHYWKKYEGEGNGHSPILWVEDANATIIKSEALAKGIKNWLEKSTLLAVEIVDCSVTA